MRMPSSAVFVGLLVLLFSAILFVPTAGCQGQRAREQVGVPAIVLAVDGVMEDARRGVAELPPEEQVGANDILDAFEDAVASRDRLTIMTQAQPRWPYVRDMAINGILAAQSAGEIGPGVALSLLERLERFQEVLMQVSDQGFGVSFQPRADDNCWHYINGLLALLEQCNQDKANLTQERDSLRSQLDDCQSALSNCYAALHLCETGTGVPQ